MNEEIEELNEQIVSQQSFLSRLKELLSSGYQIKLVSKKPYLLNAKPALQTNLHSRTSSATLIKHTKNNSLQLADNQAIELYSPEKNLGFPLQLSKPESDCIEVAFDEFNQETSILEKFTIEKAFDSLEKLNILYQKGRCDYNVLSELYNQLQTNTQKLLDNKEEQYNIEDRRLLLGILINCSVQQGLCYKKLNYLSLSIQCFENVIKNFEINDPEISTSISFELGQINFFQKNFVKSLNIFSELLIMYERLNWRIKIAQTLQYVAIIFAIFQQSDEAKRIAFEAQEILKKSLKADHPLIGESLDSFGLIFFLNKEYEASIGYFLKAKKIKKKANDRISLAKTQNSLGQAFLMNQNATRAEKHFKKAKDLLQYLLMIYDGLRSTDDVFSQTLVLNNLAITLITNGDVDQGHELLKRAKTLRLDLNQKQKQTQIIQSEKNIKRIEKYQS